MNLTDIVVIFTLTFLIVLAALGYFSAKQAARQDSLIAGLLMVVTVAAAVSIYGDIFLKMSQHPVGYVRTWNVFHHYLGAKYFPELGYFKLYSCALAADAQIEGVWHEQTPVRNLTTYTIGNRQDTPPCPETQFSDRRWAWFRSDLLLIQQTTFPGPEQPRAGDQSPQSWQTILTDKGFNPSPVWATLGWWLTNRIPLDSGLGLKILLSLDVALLSIALLFVGRVFGWQTAALAFAFLLTFWGPYRRLMGNVVQYSWLFAVIVAFCFWQLGWLRTSAAFFAYAILTRIFPIFFLAGLGVKFGHALFKRQTDVSRKLGRFFGWILLWAALFFSVSFLLPNGSAAWLEFFENIQRHGAILHQEMLNVGLKNLISTCCNLVNTTDMFEYSQPLGGRYGLYGLLAIALLSLFVRYCLQPENSDLDILRMGYIPMFALVTVSRYYYVGLVIMMLSGQNRRMITIGLLGTNLAMYLMRWFLFTQDETLFYSFWIIQGTYLLLFAGLLVPWVALKPIAIDKTRLVIAKTKGL